jgi:hypothetical protein
MKEEAQLTPIVTVEFFHTFFEVKSVPFHASTAVELKIPVYLHPEVAWQEFPLQIG